MSRNIKEIGKELLGKSLNSFHRKTGLTQLEKNNEMQDGILDGILSQVDDAYIEKTEQSNVIHLDGSGDGVVVLDSVEGNTMVNLYDFKDRNDFHSINNKVIINGKNFRFIADGTYQNAMLKPLSTIKPNTTYTIIVNIIKNTLADGCLVVTNSSANANLHGSNFAVMPNMQGRLVGTVTTKSDLSNDTRAMVTFLNNTSTQGEIEVNIVVLEGDWTNRDLPPYFEGLQSSFEEKINNEGKYEIEILMKNKNLFDGKLEQGAYNNVGEKITNGNYALRSVNKIKVNPNTTYTFSMKDYTGTIYVCEYHNDTFIKQTGVGSTRSITTNPLTNYITFNTSNNGNSLPVISDIQLETGNRTSYVPNKQNKIKLLLDEPLRNKDKLCIKDGKIVVERNSKQSLLDGNLNWAVNNSDNEGIYSISTTDLVGVPKGYIISDKLPTTTTTKNEGVMLGITTGKVMVCIDRNKLTNTTLNGMKQYLNENPMQVVFDIETYYEEVVNEYGEPILLEGYENGTLYIDSTIVPTTTVRYTPKMESFKTLNEVSDNNTMLTNDVNDNIIPYMMDVDLMIMEKEMALMSHKYKLRRTGEKDMTSMQKRTQDMLERLIKGKTLTEQECKTRVTTYLNAGKITDAQAEELNFLIDEIYA